ncbi:MAG: hypothetical protein KDM64_19130, partial [Verrucomicrobiae bacterium]|nr:hypothetical protein [Verrucomicrobiae bacterium]
LALALCSAGLVLFAGYVIATFRSDENRTVSNMAHLQIFRHGFPEKGIGNPAAYTIDDYDTLRAELLADPELAPLIEVVTGQLLFTGLASEARTSASAAFVGMGVVPAEYATIAEWNPYRLVRPQDLAVNPLIYRAAPDVDETDPDGGALGIGLARVLGIRLTGEDDPKNALAPQPEPPSTTSSSESAGDLPNFAALEAATTASAAAPSDSSLAGRPTIELLCQPRTGGIPNVSSLGVRSLKNCATERLDECLVTMPLSHASALLFPGEPPRVNAVLLLLHRTEDVDAAVARIRERLQRDHPDLECRTWIEL